MEQGADEGRPREKVSGASMNAADTPRVRRAGVASLSRAELEGVAMKARKGRRFIAFSCLSWGPPPLGGFRRVAKRLTLWKVPIFFSSDVRAVSLTSRHTFKP